jgi:predicted metal-dependent hydrolase
VGLGAGADASQIRDLVQSWLQRQALELFKQRCQHYAPRLGVTVKRLALSNATTRWGSATSQGHIRLNWRLIHHALPTIDYVVVHELAHLREMNHSPAFWDVVRSVIPDLDQHRGTLKDETLPLLD